MNGAIEFSRPVSRIRVRVKDASMCQELATDAAYYVGRLSGGLVRTLQLGANVCLVQRSACRESGLQLGVFGKGAANLWGSWGKRRGDDGYDAARNPMSNSADEGLLVIDLSNSERKRMCSAEFANDLCNRVMSPALAELDRFFGEGWCRKVAPAIVLEGPGLAFTSTILKLPRWELMEMNTRIAEVFNRHWDREVDRVPPR